MENLAYSYEPDLNLQEWLKEKRKGISDEAKYVKRFYGLECGILPTT